MQKNKIQTIPQFLQYVVPSTVTSHSQSQKRYASILAIAVFILMICCIIVLGTILPLRSLAFYQAFPSTTLESHLLFLSHLLFPHYPLAPAIPNYHPHAPSAPLAWYETSLFFASATLLFLCYLLALRLLPDRISPKFLFLSTVLLGLLFALYPVVTSQDVFLYSIYARIALIYHMNPLTVPPSAIHSDPFYPLIYWVDEPSAYGPVWILLTSFCQWIALLIAPANPTTIVLLLRLVALIAHLGSTIIVWHLSGIMQQRFSSISLSRRIFATLAFAWNPLLLLEAATNAHIDTLLLFLILLAVWMLASSPTLLPSLLLASLFLALAAAMKITFVLLAPGLLLFVWLQHTRWLSRAFSLSALYVLVLGLLYLPFWQHGAALHVFQMTAGATHDVNSPYEFIVQFVTRLNGHPLPGGVSRAGAPGEILSHEVSTVLFAAGYILISIKAFWQRHHPPLLALIRWAIQVWLLYCFVGSPWLWPWYFILFFGLFALLEATSTPNAALMRHASSFARLLIAAALGIYLFSTWAPTHTYLALPFINITYNFFRGLWLCILPLFALYHFPWRLLRRQFPFPSLPFVKNQSLSND